MEVVCLILGPMLASRPCSHAFWVLPSLHLLSFLLKMFFIILVSIVFFFEGVIPSQMKLLLVHFVDAKYFTIDLLNSRLTHFDFMNKKPSLFDPKVLKSER